MGNLAESLHWDRGDIALIEGVWGAGPGFLISVTSVTCPCLSVFWRDRAGIFVLLFFLLTAWFEKVAQAVRPHGASTIR
jgi:hypothetical protein